MRFVVEPDVFALYPELRIGVLRLEGIDSTAAAGLSDRARAAQDAVRRRFVETAVIEHPRIECWRAAYRAFGAKPKKHPSSIENLVRRTLKGEELRPIHPLVDAYNVISLEHLLPVGGEDLDALTGDLRLARAGEQEPAAALLGDPEPRPPAPGEVFYTDDAGAVCRRFNWKEADRTKLESSTTRALLVVEALPPVGPDEHDEALEALSKLARDVVGGEERRWMLDRSQSSVELDG